MELQIYFLSCVSLILVGVRLSYEKFGELLKTDAIFREEFVFNRTFNIISSVVAMLFGLFQILYVDSGRGNSVPIIADIIPGLLGILGGAFLLLSIFNKGYEGTSKFVIAFYGFIKTNIAIIGVLMIIVGFIHAIFPAIILL